MRKRAGLAVLQLISYNFLWHDRSGVSGAITIDLHQRVYCRRRRNISFLADVQWISMYFI